MNIQKRDLGSKPERNVKIVKRALQNEAYAKISRDFDLTRERVRQICTRAGLSRRGSEWTQKYIKTPKKYSKEDLLEHLRQVSEKYGGVTPGAKILIEESPPSHTLYWSYFDSLIEAQREAGLVPNEFGFPQLRGTERYAFGVNFRSETEKAFAEWLTKTYGKEGWEYEPDRIPYTDDNGQKREMIPDFYVEDEDCYYCIGMSAAKTERQEQLRNITQSSVRSYTCVDVHHLVNGYDVEK